MAAELLISLPDGSTQQIALTGDEMVIGREAQLPISLPDTKASRRHAKLIRRGANWWIEDLGSANGTLVDGLPLSGQAFLTPGSQVRIGDCQLMLRLSEEVAIQWLLQITEGQRAGERIALNEGSETIVGRGQEADVALGGTSVSRRHARLTPQPDGQVRVEDLGSSNGTFIDSDRLSGPRLVAAGTTIRFGTIACLLLDAAAPQMAPQANAAAPAANAASGRAKRPVAPAGEPTGRGLRRAGRRLPMGTWAGAGAALLVIVGAWLFFGRGPSRHEAREGLASDSNLPTEPAPKSGGWLDGLTGPSKAERAWRKERDAATGEAKEALARGALEDASAAALRALALDPGHSEALSIRLQSQRLQRQARAMAHARQFADKQAWAPLFKAASDALILLPTAQDDPTSEARLTLEALLQKAARKLAASCSDEARQACAQNSWTQCAGRAACALGYQPNEQASLAALNLVASAVSGRAGLVGGDGGFDPDAPHIDPRAASTQYPGERIRQAVLRYAAGDVRGAATGLQQIGNAESRRILADMRELLHLRQRAQTEREAGRCAQALQFYEQALIVDGRLVPTDVPSGPRGSLIEDSQTMFLAVGRAALADGRTPDALSTWARGLKLDPTFIPLRAASAELARKARALMQKATDASRNGLGVADAQGFEPCAAFREVVTLTAVDDPLHEAASAQIEGCRRQTGSNARRKKAH